MSGNYLPNRDMIDRLRGLTEPMPVSDTGWQNFDMLSDWQSDTDHPAQYAIREGGIVHLRGIVKNGWHNTAIARLPEGARPEYTRTFKCFVVTSVLDDSDIELRIFPDGIILIDRVVCYGNDSVDLTGTHFPAHTYDEDETTESEPDYAPLRPITTGYSGFGWPMAIDFLATTLVGSQPHVDAYTLNYYLSEPIPSSAYLVLLFHTDPSGSPVSVTNVETIGAGSVLTWSQKDDRVWVAQAPIEGIRGSLLAEADSFGLLIDHDNLELEGLGDWYFVDTAADTPYLRITLDTPFAGLDGFAWELWGINGIADVDVYVYNGSGGINFDQEVTVPQDNCVVLSTITFGAGSYFTASPIDNNNGQGPGLALFYLAAQQSGLPPNWNVSSGNIYHDSGQCQVGWDWYPTALGDYEVTAIICKGHYTTPRGNTATDYF